jgi:hypothetical protein
MPLAMMLTRQLGYWMRSGFEVMPGDAEQLFEKMREDQRGAWLIYISAQ